MGFAGSLIKRSYLFFLAALVLAGCAGGTAAVRQEKAVPLAKLQKVDVKDGEKTVDVLILTDKPVTFTTVRVSDPPKMVVELAGAELGDVRQTIKSGKVPVEYISPSAAPGASRIVRLEIGLTAPVSFKTAQSGQAINIVFEKPNPEAEASPAKPEAAEKASAEPAPAAKAAVKPDNASASKGVPQAAKPTQEKPAVQAVAEKPAPPLPEAKSVKGISYEKQAGGYIVRIEGDGRFGSTKVFKLGSGRLVIDLSGVSSVKDKLAVVVNGRPLKGIRMARHEGERKVRVVLDLTGPSQYETKSDGNALLVAIGLPGSNIALNKTAPAAKAEAPASAEAKPEARKVSAPAPAQAENKGRPINVYISKAGGKTILSSAPIDQNTAAAAAPGAGASNYVETATKIYTGGRISFDIQDAELDKVIKLLADVAGLNLIMDPADVKGKVTLKLDNVPWDQALDTLLKIYGLDKVIEGNVLRVTTKSKLDDEKRKELLQIAEQKKLEQQAEDLYTKTFKVNYTTATDLEPKVKKVLSPRGDATANPNTNELIVTDIKENIAKVGDLIALLDKQVNQIMIEARILTVDVEYSQSLGVTWGLTRKVNGNNPNIGYVGGAGAQGSSAGVVGVTPTASPGGDSYQLSLPAQLAATAAGGMMGSFAWGHLLKGVNLDLTIQALEDINKAEVLAAPKVFTLENQSANIVSGTTLYVQTTSASGTAPAPLNANLSLTVTPRVTGNDYIMMQVTATNNQPETPPAGSTAAISTQAVTTNVIVKDGDTIVLGGIYIKNKSNADAHIPLLGRIPIIKYLFSSNNWTDKTAELLIFISPKLVKQSQKV